MKRREFLTGAAALPLLTQAGFSKSRSSRNGRKIIKPKRLMKGDTVAVIAPSSAVEVSAFEKALQNLADLGLKIKIGKSARARKGFLAGTDKGTIGRFASSVRRPGNQSRLVRARRLRRDAFSAGFGF
jgi:hypothetical protein